MRNLRILPPKFLAAMIAVLPLPGSPLYDGDDQRVFDQALADVEVYKNAGVDSILFENDHDLPYIQPPLDKNGIALMTEIVNEARSRFEKPIGIQMLEAANITSLEIFIYFIGQKIFLVLDSRRHGSSSHFMRLSNQ